MTTVDIIRQVGRSFGDTDQIIITNADIFDWINEAQLEICKKTECIISTTTSAASAFPLAARTLMPTFIRARRVTYGQLPLVELEISKLDDAQVDQSVRINSPQYYYWNGGILNLYPLQPTGDVTVVTIDYVATASLITSTIQNPGIPDLYSKEIISYCLAKAHERGENNTQYTSKMQEFQAGVNEDVDNEFNRSSSYPVIRDDPWGDW